MIRFAWLQSRTQTLVTAALLTALAVTATITGVHFSNLYHSLVGHCQTGCDLATSDFLSHGHFMQRMLDLVAQVVPALFGIFWGAPLLTREFETGTYRLAWTQSVTRSRWLVTKLAVVGTATAVLAGALTLTITWWYRQFDVLDSNQYAVFERRDIAPIGYAVFAFALGTLVGALVRRTLPAMAATLVGFVFARVAVQLWVRPHLIAPLHKATSLLVGGMGFEISDGTVHVITKGAAPANSWEVSSNLATSSGLTPTTAQVSAYVHQYCPAIAVPPAAGQSVGKAPDPSAFQACQSQLARAFHLVVSYQPASRYWTFQWLETGIFVALALLAAVGCYWVVTRRTA
ncbi:transporter [Acidothermaceae bacterium B102]|nr:transporter [Acidothermaceae bacterium B102]